MRIILIFYPKGSTMVRFPLHSYAEHLRSQAARPAQSNPHHAAARNNALAPTDTLAHVVPGHRSTWPVPTLAANRLLNGSYGTRPCAPDATAAPISWERISGPDGCISPW